MSLQPKSAPHGDKERGGALDSERRRSRRRPTPSVLVAIETPSERQDLCWAGTAIDINGNGIGVSLPDEVAEGNKVLLTFRLGEAEFHRVPGTVLRKDGGYGFGAVEFGTWPDRERLELLSFLLER